MRFIKNKKAEGSDLFYDNAIYLVLLGVFLVVMVAFLQQQRHGAAVWEDYYVKAIVGLIERSEGGEQVTINVQRGTEVAVGNKMEDFKKMFVIDNEKNEVCVQFSVGKKTCMSYFNNVEILDWELKLGRPINKLHFRIWEGKNA